MKQLYCLLLILLSTVCSASDQNLEKFSLNADSILAPRMTFNGYGHSSMRVDPNILHIVNDLFKKYVPLTSPVIDIGCGFGSNSCGICKCGYENVFAVDLDSHNFFINEQLHRSVHFIEGAFPNTDVLERLPINNWGIALSTHVFHFMSDTEIDQSLEIIFSKLRSPGFLLCHFLGSRQSDADVYKDYISLDKYKFVNTTRFKEKLLALGFKIYQYSQIEDGQDLVVMAIAFKGEWQAG